MLRSDGTLYPSVPSACLLMLGPVPISSCGFVGSNVPTLLSWPTSWAVPCSVTSALAGGGGVNSTLLRVQLGPPWQVVQPAAWKTRRPSSARTSSAGMGEADERIPNLRYAVIESRSRFRPAD